MRRLLIALLGVCLAAAPARAQAADTIAIVPGVLAVTYCGGYDGQPHTWVNIAVLESPTLFEEVRIHEAVHRADMRANPQICAREDPKLVLRTEVHAYCISNRVAVHFGADPMKKATSTLSWLLQQFDGLLTPIEVNEAWRTGCTPETR